MKIKKDMSFTDIVKLGEDAMEGRTVTSSIFSLFTDKMSLACSHMRRNHQNLGGATCFNVIKSLGNSLAGKQLPKIKEKSEAYNLYYDKNAMNLLNDMFAKAMKFTKSDKDQGHEHAALSLMERILTPFYENHINFNHFNKTEQKFFASVKDDLAKFNKKLVADNFKIKLNKNTKDALTSYEKEQSNKVDSKNIIKIKL